MWYWTHYKEELGYLSVLVVIAIQFVVGKGKNNEIATNWRINNLPSLVGQYPHLGCTQEMRSLALVQKAYAEYGYFASGR